MAVNNTKAKKRNKKNIPVAIVCIKASFNNIIVTITDLYGNVISWSSAGVQGFSGAKQSTPYAAQMTAADAAEKAAKFGVKTVAVYVKGPGTGREGAVREIANFFKVTLVQDRTPVPHNGCRPRKKKRV